MSQSIACYITLFFPSVSSSAAILDHHAEINAAGSAYALKTSAQLLRKVAAHDVDGGNVLHADAQSLQATSMPNLWNVVARSSVSGDDVQQSSCCSSDTVSSTSTTAGQWIDQYKFIYSGNVTECKSKCVTIGAMCKGFVEFFENVSPKYCIFKTSQTTITQLHCRYYGKITTTYPKTYTKTANRQFTTASQAYGSIKASVDTAGTWTSHTSGSAGTWRDENSNDHQNAGSCYFYSSVDDCKKFCSASGTCKGFVVWKTTTSRTVPYCCFKKTSATVAAEAKTDRDAYAKS